MEVKELLIIFEKMYLQESEIKEKITIRVQIVFTLILAMITVSSYMLRMLDLDRYVYVAASIIAFLMLFLVCLGIASKYAVGAFWGNTFKLMPPAGEFKGYYDELVTYNGLLDSYRVELERFQQGNECPPMIDVRSEFELHLSNTYEECASHNSEVNQARSRKVHESFKWLLGAFVPLGVAGSLFVSFDMDVSSPRKNFQVIDKYVGDRLGNVDAVLKVVSGQADEIKEILMSKEKVESNLGADKNAPSTTPPPKSVAPVKPSGPQVRIVLEDSLSRSFEVNDDSKQK